ncbi:hypothetical protein MMC29_008435 [Sticta canariensis]|nr:hypothetical protein [Sticta canariensis]
MDTSYSGLELNLNVSGLEPLSIDHGPEPTPAEWYEKIAPQVLIGTKIEEVMEGDFPAGLTVQKPSEYLPRKKSRNRLTEPTASNQHFHPPTPRLEFHPAYSKPGLNLNVSGLEPVSIDHGPEPTPAESYEKIAPEVLIGTKSKEVIEGDFPAGLTVQKPSEYLPRKKSRNRLAVASILLVVLITITVSVSVTQSQNRSRSSPMSSGVPGATHPSTHHDGDYSTSGAFKGTGLIPYSPDRDGKSSFLLFQHYTGQIRQLTLNDNGFTWAEGSSSDVIVGSDVRNATPIAVASYEKDNISWTHLVYIDTSHLLQDLVRSSESDEWQKGILGELHMVTSESPTVGLAGSWATSTVLDLRLYYGTRENLIQELTYHPVNGTWQSGFLFPMSSGNSGISIIQYGCIHYMVCLNSDYQLEIWWKDVNISAVASSVHPVGVWTRGPFATNVVVGHNSSLSWDSFGRLLYQDPSNKIVEIETRLQSELSGFIYHESLQEGREALAAEPNTHIRSAFNSHGNISRPVYYLQTNASNIVGFEFEGHNYTEYKTRNATVCEQFPSMSPRSTPYLHTSDEALIHLTGQFLNLIDGKTIRYNLFHRISLFLIVPAHFSPLPSIKTPGKTQLSPLTQNIHSPHLFPNPRTLDPNPRWRTRIPEPKEERIFEAESSRNIHPPRWLIEALDPGGHAETFS